MRVFVRVWHIGSIFKYQLQVLQNCNTVYCVLCSPLQYATIICSQHCSSNMSANCVACRCTMCVVCSAVQHIDSDETRFVAECPHVVADVTRRPRSNVELIWTAPSSGAGCIEFRCALVVSLQCFRLSLLSDITSVRSIVCNIRVSVKQPTPVQVGHVEFNERLRDNIQCIKKQPHLLQFLD